MESNRELIESVIDYSCSFKPAKKPSVNLSNTYEQIHQG
jgi:hypothetical protein